MAKTKLFLKEQKTKRKLKSDVQVIPWNPQERIADAKFISQAIQECLTNDDIEGVIEILHIYKTNSKKHDFDKKIDKLVQENPDLTHEFIKNILISMEDRKLNNFTPYTFDN